MTSGAQPGAEGRTDLIAQVSAPDAALPPTGRGKLRIYLGTTDEWHRPRHDARQQG